MGDRVLPRAEDGLAPHRHLILGALAPLALLAAGCGGTPYTNVTFRNDLGNPVQLWLCREPTCNRIQWTIGVDPGMAATEQIRSDGKATRRFLVITPPEHVYGCLVFHFDGKHPDVEVPLSRAHGCGGRR